MTDFMARNGARLVDNGFPVIPIWPGTKKPGRYTRGEWHDYPAWTRHCDRPTTLQEIEIWATWPDAAVGFACGPIVGIDIDVLDAALAHRIEKLARQMLGDTTLVRIGRAPKRMLVYRAETPFAAFRRAPLEVLAHGRQFVAFAIHPDTGEPYQWTEESPLSVDVSTLPAITEERARGWLDAAIALVPAADRPTTLEANEASRPPAGHDQAGTADAVTEALAFIPNADLDYDSWIRVGMAIKGALGDEGMALFTAWSAQSVKNVPDTTAKAWAGFKPTAIGAGTLYRLAIEAGWKPDPALVLNGAVRTGPEHPAAAMLEKLARPEPVPPALLSFTLGHLLDDTSPMPADILTPRLLTPGGILVLGGPPKVGKSDFLINLLVHAAAGMPFLGFTPNRPLRIFYLQAEIQYDYLRERLQHLRLDPSVLAAARENFIATPKVRMLLNAAGMARAVTALRDRFADTPPDIICLDPIRNLFDGGPTGEGENDNAAMLFFLQDRVEALRDAVAPDAGVILCHHTKKLPKKLLAEDPFQALSGASALRGFYTSGLLMYRPDEDRPERLLQFELRNGPAIRPKLVDKIDGRWIEIDRSGERLIRKSLGNRLDAERLRKRDVILQLLFEEARQGRLFTINQFTESFENQAGLGSKDTIRDRLNVLATKGYVRFVHDGSPYGLGSSRSRFGYLCVEGMTFPTGHETVDPATGEITADVIPVQPTHYKSPQNGAVLEVEDPDVWVYPDGDEP